MRRVKFYTCKKCGDIIVSLDGKEMYCCGEKLDYSEPQEALGEDKLKIEKLDNELFISANHPDDKDNYINFVAYLRIDTMLIKRHYPEWDLDFRFPYLGQGKLIFNSTSKGIFVQRI